MIRAAIRFRTRFALRLTTETYASAVAREPNRGLRTRGPPQANMHGSRTPGPPWVRPFAQTPTPTPQHPAVLHRLWSCCVMGLRRFLLLLRLLGGRCFLLFGKFLCNGAP